MRAPALIEWVWKRDQTTTGGARTEGHPPTGERKRFAVFAGQTMRAATSVRAGVTAGVGKLDAPLQQPGQQAKSCLTGSWP